MKMLGKHAEQAKEYAKFYREQLLCDVAPYWVNSEMLDKEYGGCITSMDREGKSYNKIITHSVKTNQLFSDIFFCPVS